MAATCAAMPAHAVVTEADLAARESRREAPLVANLRQLAPETVDAYELAVRHMRSFLRAPRPAST